MSGALRKKSYRSKPKQIHDTDNVVSGLDFLPTFCNLAGLNTPEFADGIDLMPLLSGKDPKHEHDVLHWKTVDEWSVRKGDWKLHQVDGLGSSVNEMVELELGTFLRNLREDPSESKNYASQHPDILAELLELHTRWVADLSVR